MKNRSQVPKNSSSKRVAPQSKTAQAGAREDSPPQPKTTEPPRLRFVLYETGKDEPFDTVDFVGPEVDGLKAAARQLHCTVAQVFIRAVSEKLRGTPPLRARELSDLEQAAALAHLGHRKTAGRPA